MAICNTCSFSRIISLIGLLKVATRKWFEMIVVKYLWWSMFLNSIAGSTPETLLKRYSATGASCEFWEMFQNSYSLENMSTAASEFPQWFVQVVKCTSKKSWSFKFTFYNVFTIWKRFKNMKNSIYSKNTNKSQDKWGQVETNKDKYRRV